MLEVIKKNFNLKMLALLAALLLWIYVRYTQNLWEGVDKYVALDVPVSYLNQPVDTTLLEAPQYVALTLKGNQEILKNLNPKSVKALVDLNNRTPGIYSLEISVIAPAGIKVLEQNPKKAIFNLQQIVSREINVTPRGMGDFPGERVLKEFNLEPRAVKVTGPASLVDSIVQIEARINLGKADIPIITRSAALPVDRNGNIVEGVKVAPAFVLLEVDVGYKAQTQIVTIKPFLTGKPAPGWRISRVTVSPANAAVINGPKEKLTSLATEPVNIEGIRRDTVREAKIITPGGVSLLKEKIVQITISLEKER